jgi:3-hydroxyisobutyrate dehydrogenase
MLADDQAFRDAWTGKNGALSGVKPGTIFIESSTVSPTWIEELSGLAKQHGELPDTPVTGSRMQAEDGKLSFLVGGSDSALEIVTPVLKAMSKEIVHLGPTGSGAKMKLINNFLCGVQIASLAEGLAWIERSGFDRDRALAVLKNGAPGSPLLSVISARVVKHDYSANFLLKLMAKDLLYAGQAATTSHVDLKTAKVALSLFEIANHPGMR